MNRLSIKNNEDFKELDVLKARDQQDYTDIDRVVKNILEDVKARGDDALIDWTEKLDGFRAQTFRVSVEAMEAAWAKTPENLKDILKQAEERIRSFHSLQREQSWYSDAEPGVCLGQKVTPIDRVGLYIPGGKAAYPSTLLMNAIPAQVAGVPEIAVFSPINQNGEVNILVMATAWMLGIKEVYGLGGAQAVGAMAYGTARIKAVDKITGPGNAYVARAKREVFGIVGIDMIAGPSEVLVVAEKGANPDWIAVDLLAQAEHDEMAAAILVTDDEVLLEAALKKLTERLKQLSRKDIAEKSIKKYGRFILTDSLERSLQVANYLAPEHLELMVKDPWQALRKVKHAGAVFLGASTPEALGDYMAGPNHTLPTSGTARFASPLGVYDFIKRSSVLQFDADVCNALSDAVSTFARAEGLEAHALSTEVRKNGV